MQFQEYRQHDALALAELVRTKQVSAAELLEIAIARCEDVNPALNAVIYKFYDEARARSREILPDAASDRPFAGVPYLIKDLVLHWKGTPYTGASLSMKDLVSPDDNLIGRKVRDAGFLPFGKTNLPEMGLIVTTEPAMYGASKNPWNMAHSTGGSSGGSAAAVSSGIVPIASANDGGGSIRVPASCCGLFGFKHSRGRVSFEPYFGEVWNGAVSEGCVSRSVRDSAAYMDMLMGTGIGDPYPFAPLERPLSEEIKRETGKLRIGYFTKHPFGDADADCQAAVQHAAKLLEGLGHEVEAIEMPYQEWVFTELLFNLVAGETAADLADIEKISGKKVKTKDVEPNTYLLAQFGKSVSAKDFVLAKRRWNELGRAMGKLHQQYDIILTPTLARRPAKLGELDNPKIEDVAVKILNTLGLSRHLAKVGVVDKIAAKLYSYFPYPPIANLTGQPSMSVPLYWNGENLPIGTMFTAAMGNDGLLFRLAAQLEQAQPWFSRVPML
jgi:amidase